MSRLKELTDPGELQRCVRGLVALSSLATSWRDAGPTEICDSVGVALISALGGALAYIAIVDGTGTSPAEAAHSRLGRANGIIPALRPHFARWLSGQDLPGRKRIPDPFGSGEMELAAVGIADGEGIIVVGFDTLEVPGALQQFLLDVVATEVAAAVGRWRAGGGEIRHRASGPAGGEPKGEAAIENARARGREIELKLLGGGHTDSTHQTASDIAYDLSQPLTAAGNSLGAIRRLAVSANAGARQQTLDVVEETGEQIRRASDILQRLRQLIVHSQTERQIQSIGAILDESLAFAMRGAEPLGIRLSIQRDADVSAVYADRLQVQQVIVNLVRNAIESMRQGPDRELTIGIERRPDRMVEFSIADTGRGIRKEVGGRTDPLTSLKGRIDTGFSVSRSIIQANGGELTVDPSERGGAVFRFTLIQAPLDRPP